MSAAFFAANAVAGVVATSSESVTARARWCACWPCGARTALACGEYAVAAHGKRASIVRGRASGKMRVESDGCNERTHAVAA